MDPLDAVKNSGFVFPSAAYLFGAFMYGVFGIAAFRYGKKMTQISTMLIGIALMVFPYFVSSTWLMYLVGAVLCGALYWFRD